MAKFKRQSTAGGVPGNMGASTNRNTTAAGPSGNNLNSSFSVMNQKIADRWDNMKKKNVGGQTVRSSLVPAQNLSQTMNAGIGGANQLNTSNNKFQSKFASKIQQKSNLQTPGQGGNSSLGGLSGNAFQSQTSVQQPQAVQPQQQKQETSGAAKSGRIGGGGGISNNSFRSRLQGLGQNAGQPGVSAQTSVPVNSNPGSSGAATHQDLKQRLDQMKMKMQALKKDK